MSVAQAWQSRRAAGRRGRSPLVNDEEWGNVRSMVEELYLRQNRNVNYILARLRAVYGLVVTARQLKSKLKAWDFDDKKISGKAYRAMFYVMKEMRQDLDFAIVLRKGHLTSVKSASKIRSEVKRQKLDGWPPAWKSLEEALIFLQCQNIQPFGRSLPAMLTTRLQRISCAVLDDVQSIRSESTSSSTDHSDNYQKQQSLGFKAFKSKFDQIPRARLYGLSSSLPGYIPATRRNVCLSKPLNPTNDYSHEAALSALHPAKKSKILLIDEVVADSTLSLADMVRQSDPGNVTRYLWEEFLGVDLTQSLQGSPWKNRRPITEFMARYIRPILANCNSKMDSYEYVDRQEARAVLRQVLEAGSQQVLLEIDWMSTAIGLHDSSGQLLTLYEDCYACVEDSDSYVARLIKPALQFIILNYTKNCQTTKDTSKTSKSRRLYTWTSAWKFDGETEFQQRISILEESGHRDSIINITLCYYYACYLLQEGKAKEALTILIRCTNSAERLLGCRHLMTVNCYVMAARGYSILGNHILAGNDLAMAVLRLGQCSRPLRTYHSKLQGKLVLMGIGQQGCSTD